MQSLHDSGRDEFSFSIGSAVTKQLLTREFSSLCWRCSRYVTGKVINNLDESGL